MKKCEVDQNQYIFPYSKNRLQFFGLKNEKFTVFLCGMARPFEIKSENGTK